MSDDDGSDEKVGYRQPPRHSRFVKGKSGNSRGRPKRSTNALPYDAVLGQTVTIRENGVDRRVTAEEAFLLYLLKRGLEGDVAANLAASKSFEAARAAQSARLGRSFGPIEVIFVAPGTVNQALRHLRMAQKLDRYRDTSRMALEPWLVEEALARFGGRRLSRDQQAVVVKATRTPKKVKWPEWWEVK